MTPSGARRAPNHRSRARAARHAADAPPHHPLPPPAAAAAVDPSIADPSHVAARPATTADAHALSADRALVVAAPAAASSPRGRVQVLLTGVGNSTTALGGGAAPRPGPTAAFLPSWPAGAAVELRGTPSSPADGRWGALSLVDVTLDAWRGDIVQLSGRPAEAGSRGGADLRGATLVVVPGAPAVVVVHPTVADATAAAPPGADAAGAWAAGARAAVVGGGSRAVTAGAKPAPAR